MVAHKRSGRPETQWPLIRDLVWSTETPACRKNHLPKGAFALFSGIFELALVIACFRVGVASDSWTAPLFLYLIGRFFMSALDGVGPTDIFGLIVGGTVAAGVFWLADRFEGFAWFAVVGLGSLLLLAV